MHLNARLGEFPKLVPHLVDFIFANCKSLWFTVFIQNKVISDGVDLHDSILARIQVMNKVIKLLL